MSDSQIKTYFGGCHCGSVRFQVTIPSNEVTVFDCNCSICTKKQNRHFIVPETNFSLLQGNDKLTVYTFGTHQAKHMFCNVCGVQSFYKPRSNPDGFGVMPHCMDKGTFDEVVIKNLKEFDGQHWEESMMKYPQIKEFSKAE